jgi:hypothetical protein
VSWAHGDPCHPTLGNEGLDGFLFNKVNMMSERFLTWGSLFLGLVLGGLSFSAGRLDAQCQYLCTDTHNECLYASSGTIVLPQGVCNLKRWAGGGLNVNCNGTTTQTVKLCSGAGSYCQAPAAGQYSSLGFGTCGSCSGTTTIACCQSCS